MKRNNYYTTGQIAQIACITKKTIRYYDEHGVFSPSVLTDSGTRLYTEEDLVKLQQVLLLKHLGFSLADIKEIMLTWNNQESVNCLLEIQLRLVENRIDQLKQAATVIRDISESIVSDSSIY